MPTPRPIITASVGETVGNVNAAAAIPRIPRAVAMPSSAVRMGRPAASTLPKPSSSTTMATTMPISSDRLSWAVGRAAWPSVPP